MIRARVLLAAAAAIHLGIAAIYAPHVPVEPLLPKVVDRALSVYGSLSGARTHFDFFAPSVSSQGRVEYRLKMKDGSERQAFLATPSGEVNNRIAMMLTFFAYPTERQRLLEGWGRYALTLFPDAMEVETRAEVFDIPPMSGAAPRGEPAWIEVGRATVRRGGHAGS